jgi:hypothetical protein
MPTFGLQSPRRTEGRLSGRGSIARTVVLALASTAMFVWFGRAQQASRANDTPIAGSGAKANAAVDAAPSPAGESSDAPVAAGCEIDVLVPFSVERGRGKRFIREARLPIVEALSGGRTAVARRQRDGATVVVRSFDGPVEFVVILTPRNCGKAPTVVPLEGAWRALCSGVETRSRECLEQLESSVLGRRTATNQVLEVLPAAVVVDRSSGVPLPTRNQLYLARDLSFAPGEASRRAQSIEVVAPARLKVTESTIVVRDRSPDGSVGWAAATPASVCAALGATAARFGLRASDLAWFSSCP